VNECGVDIPRESDSALSEESELDDIRIAFFSWFCREEDLGAVIDEADFEGGSTSPELRVRSFVLLPATLLLGGSAFLAFVSYLEVGEGESASEEDAPGSSASTSDAESKELVSDSSDTMHFLRVAATRTPGLERGNPSLESEDIEAFAP
jgi:hypothetical protein